MQETHEMIDIKGGASAITSLFGLIVGWSEVEQSLRIISLIISIIAGIYAIRHYSKAIKS
jgi:hypothetical protein